jgi:ketosteroid isomerase-like protein
MSLTVYIERRPSHVMRDTIIESRIRLLTATMVRIWNKFTSGTPILRGMGVPPMFENAHKRGNVGGRTHLPRRRSFHFGGALAIACSAFVFAADQSTALPEIPALLSAQAAAWNRGDIEGFMQAYTETADLRFASGGNVTFGWRPTLERYKQRYPDKAAMGTLDFTDLEITPLAPDAAVVFGRWKLTREKDTPHGLFTLTLKKTSAGWRIIQDHTSSAQ